MGRLRWRLVGHRLRELLTRLDRELGERVAQVTLDRPLGHEQLLRDLAVRHPVARHGGDAALARRQGVAPARGEAAWTCAGGDELFACVLGERARATAVREVHSLPEWPSRLGSAAGPAERRAKLDERARMLDLGVGGREHVDRLLESIKRSTIPLDAAEHTQRRAQPPREPEAPRELDLVLGERARLGAPVDGEVRKGRGRAPVDRAGDPQRVLAPGELEPPAEGEPDQRPFSVSASESELGLLDVEELHEPEVVVVPEDLETARALTSPRRAPRARAARRTGPRRRAD